MPLNDPFWEETGAAFLRENPSPETQAQQRGYLAQVPVGVVRGLGGALASVPRALSAIPGVRTLTEPIAEGIDRSLPLSSGGYLEGGVESATRSVATGGLAYAALAATGGLAAPGVVGLASNAARIAAITGATYGLGEGAESRKRLEEMNATLVSTGQPPLSTGEIYQIAGTRGVIEGGLETLSNFIIAGRFLNGRAAQAVKNATLERLPGVAGRLARETVISATTEVPTEMLQAGLQAATERGVLGEARTQALTQAGQPVSPPPIEASGRVVGPALVASALFGGAQTIAARPMTTSGGAVQNAGTPIPRPLPFTKPPDAPAETLDYTVAHPPQRSADAFPAESLDYAQASSPQPTPVAPVIPPPTTVGPQYPIETESTPRNLPFVAPTPPLTSSAVQQGQAILAQLQTNPSDAATQNAAEEWRLENAGTATGPIADIMRAMAHVGTTPQLVPSGTSTSVPLPFVSPPAAPPATPAPPAPTPTAPVATDVPSAAPTALGLQTPTPATAPQPGEIRMVRPQDVTIDAEKFQYKREKSKEGATGSLADEDEFNLLKAGVTHVWLNPTDDKTYMVNGHNRHKLAMETQAPGMNVMYIPAATESAARAEGAMLNIADDKGTAIDAAIFFRELKATPEELRRRGITLSGPVAREGLALANLNPSLFAAVQRGEFPETRGVIIGQSLPAHAQQFALLKLLDAQEKRGKRVSNETLRELARMAQEAPTRTATQETLFGTEESTQNLAVEKAQLLAWVRDRLSKDKKLFALVGQTGAAQDLSRAGNVIDVARTQEVSEEAAQLLDLFDRLKHLSGPIRQSIDDAATRIAGGENATKVRTALYTQLATDLPAALRGGSGGSVEGLSPDMGTDAGVPSGATSPTTTTDEPELFGAPPAAESAGVSPEPSTTVPDVAPTAIDNEAPTAQTVAEQLRAKLPDPDALAAVQAINTYRGSEDDAEAAAHDRQFMQALSRAGISEQESAQLLTTLQQQANDQRTRGAVSQANSARVRTRLLQQVTRKLTQEGYPPDAIAQAVESVRGNPFVSLEGELLARVRSQVQAAVPAPAADGQQREPASPTSEPAWTPYRNEGYAYREVGLGKWEVRDPQGEVLPLRPSSETGAKTRITRLANEAKGIADLAKGGIPREVLPGVKPPRKAATTEGAAPDARLVTTARNEVVALANKVMAEMGGPVTNEFDLQTFLAERLALPQGQSGLSPAAYEVLTEAQAATQPRQREVPSAVLPPAPASSPGDLPSPDILRSRYGRETEHSKNLAANAKNLSSLQRELAGYEEQGQEGERLDFLRRQILDRQAYAALPAPTERPLPPSQTYRGFTLQPIGPSHPLNGQAYQAIYPRGPDGQPGARLGPEAMSMKQAKESIDREADAMGLPKEGHLQVLQGNVDVGKGPVTLAEVQRLFRGQDVTEGPGGTIRVAMPVQGHTVEVRNVAHITPTQAELELSTGQSVLGPTQAVLGRETPMGQGLFVIEVTPGRTTTTLHHEGEHFFEDSGLLNDRDVATLNRTLHRQGKEPTAENRADLVAARLNANTADIAVSPLMRVIRKIQQFLDKLAQLMGMRTTGQVVRSIQSGAIFQREGGEGPAGTGQLELPPGPARLAPQSKVTNEDGTLKVVHHGTARDFPDFDQSMMGTGAGQMFSGFFFAEDADVASGYATYRGAGGVRSDVADLEKAIAFQRQDLANIERHIAEEQTRPNADQNIIGSLYLQRSSAMGALLAGEEKARVGPNVRPVYLDIKNPFDMTQEMEPENLDPVLRVMDARGWDFDYALEKIEAANDVENLMGAQMYKALAQNVLDEQGKPIGVRGVSQALEEAGYDGLYHEGKKDGKVWVAFSPEQIIPVLGNAQQRRGRLQVVTDQAQQSLPGLAAAGTQISTGTAARVAPPATPRPKATYGTQLRSMLEYNAVFNTMTPPMIAELQRLNDEGHAFFQKEYVPVRIADERAQAIADEWRDPAKLALFLQRTSGDPMSSTTPRQGNEFQARALQILAEEHFRFMFNAQQAGVLTPDAYQAFLDNWDSCNSIMHHNLQAGSVTGRSLRMRQETPSSLTIWTKLHADLNALLKSGKIPEEDVLRLRQQIDQAMATNDISTLQNIRVTPPTLKDYFWELYYASLYNISTWSTNLWSTTGFQAFHQGLVEPLAGGLDKAFSRVNQREQQIYSNVALRAFTETFRGMPTAFQHAWWLWKKDPQAEAIPMFHRRDTAQQQDVAQSLGAWERATYKGRPVHWMRAVAPVITATSRALEAMDVALRENVFNARLQALSEQASERTLGRKDDTWQRDWQQRQVREETDVFQKVLGESRYLAFHDKTGDLGNLILGGRKVPGLGFFWQMLFPFAKTPDRLLARGLEMLPIAGMAPWIFRNARPSTNLKWAGWLPYIGREALTDEASMVFAKQMVGTLMAAALYAAWSQGDITGAAPDDPAEREAMYRRGALPNSLRVGDTWYSWRRFEPMSLPLSIVVSAFESIDRLVAKRERTGEVSTGVVSDGLSLASVASWAMVTNVLESSYFAGAAQFLQATQRGREAGDVPKGIFRQIGTMITPWSSLQRAIIRGVDSLGEVPGTTPGQTLIRSPEGLVETIAGMTVPGAYSSAGPPIRRDIFGRPQFRQTTLMGELTPGIPPVERGTATNDPVEAAFQALRYYPGGMAKSDETGKTYPREIHAEMMRRRGELAKPKLDQLVNSAAFDRLDPMERKKKMQNILSDAGSRAKREVLASTR